MKIIVESFYRYQTQINSRRMVQSQHLETDIYEAYARWSATYDQQTNPTRDLSTKVLRRLLPPLTNLSVVEVGCGTGVNTVWLAPECRQLIGLDLSDRMLAIAQQKVPAPHVQFKQQDVQEDWGMAPQSADLVLMNLVLEHIEEIEPVLRNAGKVMKTGATLIITEYHPDRVQRGTGARIEQVAAPPIRIANFWHPITEYKQLAQPLGLEIVSIQEWAKEENNHMAANDVPPLLLSLVLVKR